VVFCTPSSFNCKLFTIMGSIPALNTSFFFNFWNLFDAPFCFLISCSQYQRFSTGLPMYLATVSVMCVIILVLNIHTQIFHLAFTIKKCSYQFNWTLSSVAIAYNRALQHCTLAILDLTWKAQHEFCAWIKWGLEVHGTSS